MIPAQRGHPTDQVIPINERLGFNPNMAPIKSLWDEGKVAIVNGIGYPNPTVRTSAAWTSGTLRAGKIATEGWLGRVIPRP